MSERHTPGPWRIRFAATDKDCGDGGYYEFESMCESMGASESFGEIKGGRFMCVKGIANNADAHLFMYAPELLSELRALALKAFDAGVDASKALALIAKADRPL